MTHFPASGDKTLYLSYFIAACAFRCSPWGFLADTKRSGIEFVGCGRYGRFWRIHRRAYIKEASESLLFLRRKLRIRVARLLQCRTEFAQRILVLANAGQDAFQQANPPRVLRTPPSRSVCFRIWSCPPIFSMPTRRALRSLGCPPTQVVNGFRKRSHSISL